MSLTTITVDDESGLAVINGRNYVSFPTLSRAMKNCRFYPHNIDLLLADLESRLTRDNQPRQSFEKAKT